MPALTPTPASDTFALSTNVRADWRSAVPAAWRRKKRVSSVGQVIMLGTLFGLMALVYGLVLRFDPEARRAPVKAAGDE